MTIQRADQFDILKGPVIIELVGFFRMQSLSGSNRQQHLVPNGETDIPAEEKLSILLGVGDESGSKSEDYIMRVFRINPDTGAEESFHTLRSGGHGEYKERTLGIFRKSETYTFQIDWQSTNNNRENNKSYARHKNNLR